MSPVSSSSKTQPWAHRSGSSADERDDTIPLSRDISPEPRPKSPSDRDHQGPGRLPRPATPSKSALNPLSFDDDHLDEQLFNAIARKLYVSHFLSTWNFRGFEFGAILFLATIFLAPFCPYRSTRYFVPHPLSSLPPRLGTISTMVDDSRLFEHLSCRSGVRQSCHV